MRFSKPYISMCVNFFVDGFLRPLKNKKQTCNGHATDFMGMFNAGGPL